MYYDKQEPIKYIPSHRILAINRGEKEEFIKVKIQKPEEKILMYIEKDIIKGKTQFTEMLKATIQDAFKRLIEPSIDREIRSDLTEKAEEKNRKIKRKSKEKEAEKIDDARSIWYNIPKIIITYNITVKE